VVVFSSNYALYQDLSERTMRLLSRFTPRLEVASIDEAWLDLAHVPPHQLVAYALQIQAKIAQYIGLPVSIGLGATKVLCKVACTLVKRIPSLRATGICNLLTRCEQEVDHLLATLSVRDLWGIGRAWATKLERKGILTARDLKAADHLWIRHWLGVGAQRIVLELRGVSCIPLETIQKPRQMIMTALSFSHPVTERAELAEAVATYAVRCAEKLRRQASTARTISVFIHTNPFDRSAPQYAAEDRLRLPFATAFTPDFLDAARALLSGLYQPGYRYKRAGVLLSEIGPQEVRQGDLFGLYSHPVVDRQEALMQVVDEINRTWGRDTLFFGAQGIHRAWFMQQRRLSSRATTRWDEILIVS
jgi:DNA polymerase V